jgi:signal peptidase II
MLYAIFGVLVIILDQWVKYWAAGNLVYGGDPQPLVPGIINLLNVHNDGAAFSFLSGANAGKIFVILAVVFTVLVIIGLATNFISGKLARWCAVFVAAGGIGNAIDRALYDYVQDMFQFSFAPSFPVFNVADVFIVVFCILFILCILFGGRKAKKADDEYEDVEELEEEEAPAPRRSRSAARRAVPEEDYEEEEEEPVRRPSRREAPEQEEASSRARRQAAAAVEEEEEEEEPPRFRNKMNTTSHSKTTRKERQNKYDDQFEQYKANRDARQRSAEYSGVSPSSPAFASSVPSYDSSDPFAEWEKTNAAISAQKAAQKTPAPERRPQKTDPAVPQASRVQEAAPAAPAAKPAPAEPQQAAPEPAAPAASPKKAEDEFSLDDILAEFR